MADSAGDRVPGAARQRRANLRLGLILASVALALAFGFAAKIALLGG